MYPTKGYAGGSSFDHVGGPPEYVCLPNDPIYQSSTDNCTLQAAGEMYGAAYGGACFPSDVPCAVCKTTSHSSTIMIPARNACYPGWVEQYHGNLASGANSHTAASQYVCLDVNPEVIPGGKANAHGKLFYAVVGYCGIMQCPPYKDSARLACVVCAK